MNNLNTFLKRFSVGVLAAFLFQGCAQNEEVTAPEEKPPRVRVFTVDTETIYPSLEFTGGVVSQEIARVHPEVEGTVEKVFHRVGDPVSKGDVLVRLDPTDYRLNLKMAEAERLKARAELDRILHGYRKEDIASARGAYNNALALYRSREKNFERNKALYESGTMTERDWTVFVQEMEAAKAMLEKASGELQKLETGYEPYDIQSASAAYQLAVAKEQMAERDLEQTEIHAPIDGVVTQRQVEVGQLVSPSAVIFEIQNPEDIWLEVEAAAGDVNRLRPGLSAMLQADTQEEPQKGFIDRISRSLNQGTKTLTLWFAWQSGENLPVLGSFASAVVNLDPLHDSIRLKREWIHLEKGNHFVWVVNSDKLKRQSVEIDKDFGDEVSIHSGIKAGSRVVVSPPASFEEGMKVDTQEFYIPAGQEDDRSLLSFNVGEEVTP